MIRRPPRSTLDRSSAASDVYKRQLPWCDGRCVQGPGTYSPRHADPRLLAIPTSWSRVADSNPDYDGLSGIGSPSRVGNPLYPPLYDVCSPTHKGHEDLTSSPPSSGLSPAVPLECSTECSNYCLLYTSPSPRD